MSDWTAMIAALLPDAEVKLAIAEDATSDAVSEVLSKAYAAGLTQEFDTVSFDHLLFLDPFLQAYGLPKTNTFKHDVAVGEGLVSFTPAEGCRLFHDILTRFTAGFLADPEKAAAVVRREDEASLAWTEGLGNHGDEFLSAKRQQGIDEWRDEQLHAPIDAARMIGLWNENEGRGYLPTDYSEAAMALFTQRPSNLLTSAFQTFGYVKFMQAWTTKGAAEGTGMAEILW